jgi:hypothetical protein
VGGIRTQFHHLIDVVPTILEAAGIQAPVMVDGIAQKPIEGVSMTYTFDKANANAPSKRNTQYFEMMGNRAIYHDGWVATTTPPQGPWLMGVGTLPNVVNGYKWELYNIAEDYSQANDLAAKMPDKLREMQELFLIEASKYCVFPLDNDVLQRALTPRPSPLAGKTVFTYSGELSGMPEGSARNTLNKSYSITAEVEIPQGGAEGMLNTIGGAFGGYGLYLVKGKPVFTSLQSASGRSAQLRITVILVSTSAPSAGETIRTAHGVLLGVFDLAGYRLRFISDTRLFGTLASVHRDPSAVVRYGIRQRDPVTVLRAISATTS